MAASEGDERRVELHGTGSRHDALERLYGEALHLREDGPDRTRRHGLASQLVEKSESGVVQGAIALRGGAELIHVVEDGLRLLARIFRRAQLRIEWLQNEVAVVFADVECHGLLL